MLISRENVYRIRMAHVMEDERIWADRDTDRPGLDEHRLKTNIEDCEASGGLYCTSEGLAEALRSVASLQLWNFVGFSLPVSSLFSLESSSLKSSDMHCEKSEVKRADATEVSSPQEETYVAQFESEYINSSVSLYQEFWMNSMKKDLHRAQHTGVASGPIRHTIFH